MTLEEVIEKANDEYQAENAAFSIPYEVRRAGAIKAIAKSVRDFLLSDEVVEMSARAMTPLLCGGQEDEFGRDLPNKQWEDVTPDWQNAFRAYARAALSSITGDE